MTEQTVTAEAVFDRAAVTRVCDLAETEGVDLELVKDDGAYLITWTGEDKPTMVYANGHQPPPRTDTPDFTPQDPWIVARVATEAVFGSDDMVLTFTPAEIRAALSPDGLKVQTALSVAGLPPEYPTGPWGRKDPVYHLLKLELVPGI
ncbi:hypothetical protein [Tessaracoccus sp.]